MGYKGFGMYTEAYSRKPKKFFDKIGRVIEKDETHNQTVKSNKNKKLNQSELDAIKQKVLAENKKRTIQSIFWFILALILISLIYKLL